MSDPSIKISALFPIVTLSVNLQDDLDQEHLNEIKSFEEYYSNSDNLNRNLGKNFGSKDLSILSDKKLKTLFKKYVDHYSQEVLGEKSKLDITTSWLNVNPPGAIHHKHAHANSKLSGCFYLNAPENTGDIVFYKFLDIDGYLSDVPIKQTDYNSSVIAFKPKQFDLFLWPSYLYHSVTRNNTPETRISLAFNTFYAETFGIFANSVELNTKY